jgi:hypothetical protein
MVKIRERYVADRNGQKTAILLDVNDYRKLLEELDSIRAYDAAKASGDEAVPFDGLSRD